MEKLFKAKVILSTSSVSSNRCVYQKNEKLYVKHEGKYLPVKHSNDCYIEDMEGDII